MDIPTIPGAVYSVVAPNACTITDTATGRVLTTTEPNQQKDFRAFGPLTTLSDPDAIYVAASTFSAAPTIGSGGGGGTTIEFDTRPTSGSTNAVTSGGLYNVLYSGKPAFGVAAQATGYGACAYAQGAKALADYACAMGFNVNASGHFSVSIGGWSEATQQGSIALGYNAKNKDKSAVCLSAYNYDSNLQTLLYIMGAGSPLATTYENGEACLGYVVKDSSGNITACGTRKLSELLTNNTAFAPAALDLDALAPTPFLPTGITEPIDLPENLTE